MLFSKSLPGSEGMGRMRKLMHALRSDPPRHLGGLRVSRIRDYQNGMAFAPGFKPEPFTGPPGDMVMIDLEAEGNYVAVRPSGTEPKIKFYMFAFEPAEQLANLETTKAELGNRLKQIGQELFALAEAV
jgi:phosphoglucomutase/phosphomannomutase